MNVFILCDLEGIAGINDIGFMDRKSEKYEQSRALCARSINLSVEAAFEAGAETVYYFDSHGGGGTVRKEAVDPRAIRCENLVEWMELLCANCFDCMIEIGSHARAGTIGGFLDHTFSSASYFSEKINGIEMSELSCHALICSAHDVPIIACIGDEAACKQAKEYIPDIYTGAVKWADCRNVATDYPNADEILQSTVKEAIANYDKVSLYRLPEPITVEITYYRTDMCEEVLAQCGADVTRVDARTLRRTVPHINTYKDVKMH